MVSSNGLNLTHNIEEDIDILLFIIGATVCVLTVVLFGFGEMGWTGSTSLGSGGGGRGVSG